MSGKRGVVFLTFAVIFALAAMRLRPPHFQHFSSRESSIQTNCDHDKKTCLEQPDSELVLYIAIFEADPPSSWISVALLYLGAETEDSTIPYHNRPPPVA